MYLLLKLIHIAGVVLFLGNIVTGVFWHHHAWRTRDPRLLAHTMAGIIRSDRLFTTPGVLIIAIAGVAAAMAGRIPILGTGWILWSIVLFVVSGAVFGTRIAPLQRQLLALARAGIERPPFDEVSYTQLAARWRIWAAIATLAPVIAVALMVLKPVL